MTLVQEAQGIQDLLVDHRHYLHQHAETGMELPVTAAYVKEQLIKMGYEPQEICQSGLLAIAGGKKPGKVVLLRADMDALPIPETTEVEFKSETGNMHACGHDLHTSMLLGAARLLKEHEDEIEGTVKLMFQPAEETLSGAKAMVAAGILENPKVDIAMMIHVASGMPLPAGKLLKPMAGALSATSDWFEIRIQGKGGHGAMPNMAIDPLIPASTIHLGLQAINSRETGAGDAIVVTVGKYCGGTTANVISDTASMMGTIRTFSNDHRAFIKKRMTEISEGIAASYRCTAEVIFSNGCPSVTTTADAVSSFNSIMADLFGEEDLISIDDVLPGGKMMGSEDFAFVTEQVPSVMTMLVAGDARKGYAYPMHHPKAIFDESVLFRGSAAYAGFALEWLKRNA